MAILVEDDHLRGLGWKRPVSSGAAYERGGSRPFHLRLSRTGVLRRISRLRSVVARRVVQGAIAYLNQVVETLGVIP